MRNKIEFPAFTYMLVLTLGQAAETLVVTLNEKRTLETGFYLFVFTNILSKEIVNKIYNFSEDNSPHPERYNDFDIDTSTVFSGKPVGQWLYNVYEQAGGSNTDPDGLTEVERGILTLKPAVDFAFDSYNAATSFKAYGG